MTDHELRDCPRCGHCCPQPEQEPDAYGYAKRLALAIWEQHYKDVAPQWKPLDDLMGVLTQIDNMTARLTTPPQQWVGLTREDMAELRQAGLHSISDYAFEVIANFLKEKNGG
jgi:hypothetical protein